DGLNGELVQVFFPGLEMLRCPIAVGALDARNAVSCDLSEEFFRDRGLGVVRIDKDCESVVGLRCHGDSSTERPRAYSLFQPRALGGQEHAFLERVIAT